MNRIEKNKDMQTKPKRKTESGNAVIVVLVVLVVVAVGALAYLSGQMTGDADNTQSAVETAAGDSGDRTQAATSQEGEGQVIQPGNPVVAEVDGQEVTRMDVFNFVQTLPPATRQLPLEQLFPMALNQVINARIIEEKTDGVNLDNDPEVKRQMELAREQIVRTVYIQKEVEKKLTDKRLKAAYEEYKKNFPKVEEVKAAHILVEDEDLAKDLVKQLGEGADFAELAKEHSTDATAANGGQLGYFTQNDVVPAFGEAAFNVKPGTYTKTPVKSEFGYHVIKVEDKRMRPPAEFEEAKPFLEAQVRRQIVEELVADWREDADVEIFGINGEENVEPAAGGQEEPAE